MQPERIKSEVNKLGLSEKLSLVEAIWDSIAIDTAQLPMPMWQKRELDERQQEYQSGKPALHNWEEVHKDLREKCK